MAEQKHQNEHLNVEEALTQSEAFLAKYKNAILIGVIVIILLIVGFFLYQNHYVTPREEKAQAALFKGEEYFGQDSFELALNGDSIGYAGFLKIIDEYNGTKAANLAKAYAGISYKQLGKYEEAINMLKDFKADDQMVSPAIVGAIGNCYAELNQLDKAVENLLAAAQKADSHTLSPIFLKQAGEILVKQGKYDEAIGAFTQIKEKYFDSVLAMDIDKYIEQAKLMKK